MQNVWKGMALGALVGAVVGMLLDAMQGAGRIAGETATHVREEAPAVAARVRDARGPRRAAARETAHNVGASARYRADRGRTGT